MKFSPSAFLIKVSSRSLNTTEGYRVTNNSAQPKKLIIIDPYRTKKAAVVCRSSIETLHGDSCEIKLLDREMRTYVSIPANNTTYLDSSRQILFFGVVIPPHSEHVIRELNLTTIDSKASEIVKQMKGDTLVLLPALPHKNTLAYESLKSYLDLLRESDLKPDVFVINADWQERSDITKDSALLRGHLSYNDLRLALQTKHYPHISLHWFDEKLAQIFDASDLSQSRLYIFPRTQDLQAKHYSLMALPYFQKNPSVDSETAQLLQLCNERILKKYAEMPNVAWVFSSEAQKKQMETDTNITFQRATIANTSLLYVQTPFERLTSVGTPIHISIVDALENAARHGVDTSVRALLHLFTSDVNNDLFEVTVFHENGSAKDLLLPPLLEKNNTYEQTISECGLQKIVESSDIVLSAHRSQSDNDYLLMLQNSGVVTVALNVNNDDYRTLTEKLIPLVTQPSVFRKSAAQAYKAAKAQNQESDNTRRLLKSLFTSDTLSPVCYRQPPRDTSPLLTVTIPSYNCEKFLMNGVLSLINHPLSHRVEVLIVNDGSKDRTAQVGRRIEELVNESRNLPVVRLIDKENGGHGSTINVGIQEAKGKYFRLMDGDDYFTTSEFVTLLEHLEHEDSDIVLTNYIEDFSVTATKNIPVLYDFMTPGIQYQLEEMAYDGYGFTKWGPLLPTSTIKTSLLKNASFKIDENSFYVDMELNLISYITARTITYYPLDIYNYYLGRPGQSMSKDSLKRNYLHHEKVSLRLIEELYNRTDSISPNKRKYLTQILIIPMCKMQYMITTEYFTSSQPFLSFDSKLKKYPEFYNHPEIAGKQVRLHRLTHGRHVFADRHIKHSISVLRKFKKR